MIQIQTSPIQSLSLGDVFTYQGDGPYVVTHKRTMDNMTTVEYRQFRNGLPRGSVFTFTRVNLSTVVILDRHYDMSTLLSKNVED